MTTEEKFLLLKDLSSRLPYGVIVQSKRYDKYADVWDRTPHDFKIIGIQHLGLITNKNRTEHTYAKGYVLTPIVKPIDDGRTISLPYLRPISSMTEEERQEYQAFFNYDGVEYPEEYIDWLNSHHFDYRSLIAKGLALKAIEGMYNLKNK